MNDDLELFEKLADTLESQNEHEQAMAAIARVRAELDELSQERGEYVEIAERLGREVERLRDGLRIADMALEACYAHAKGLQMDTEDDERVRLKLVAMIEETRALLAVPSSALRAGDGSQSEAAHEPAKCAYCGLLDWTVEQHGRVTHKHACPHRGNTYCQTHPDGCPDEPAKDSER